MQDERAAGAKGQKQQTYKEVLPKKEELLSRHAAAKQKGQDDAVAALEAINPEWFAAPACKPTLDCLREAQDKH
eukprot:11894547-Karenia_brevis.AAC.1